MVAKKSSKVTKRSKVAKSLKKITKSSKTLFKDRERSSYLNMSTIDNEREGKWEELETRNRTW